MSMLLGLSGFGLVALALGIYLGRSNSFGLGPLAVTGYIVGAALVGGALILRYALGVVKSVLVLFGVGTTAFFVAVLAFLASFFLYWEF
ncbi:hypothetical protein ACQEVF_17560 [Nonomuraea polychroma]|uniref:hypothetical protein n=1 Tax=Nonomuraea polychroma TaxID=46176 RepID=UPI003D8ED14D